MCYPNSNDCTSPSEGGELLQRAGYEFVNLVACLWVVVTCLTSELGQLYVTHVATETIKINRDNERPGAVVVSVSVHRPTNALVVGSKRVGVG